MLVKSRGIKYPDSYFENRQVPGPPCHKTAAKKLVMFSAQ